MVPRVLADVLTLRPLAPVPAAVPLDGVTAERLVGSLLDALHTYLQSLHNSELVPIMAAWPERRSARPLVAATLPVLRYWGDVIRQAPPESRPLMVHVEALVNSLAWRQTYAASQVHGGFLDRYGYAELVGLSGPVPSEQLAIGVLMLGPGVLYPRHRHEADEVYIPLSGRAQWQQGDAEWRRVEPGTVLHHASDVPHAMRTDNEPLLALYVWRSQQLDQHARFDPPIAGS